jgi:hypothetical protein
MLRAPSLELQMANLFDNEVVLEAFGGGVVFRDVPTGTDLLRVLYTAVDPNGILDAPVGSLASGAAGTFQSTGPLTWVLLGGGGADPFLRPSVTVAEGETPNLCTIETASSGAFTIVGTITWTTAGGAHLGAFDVNVTATLAGGVYVIRAGGGALVPIYETPDASSVTVTAEAGGIQFQVGAAVEQDMLWEGVLLASPGGSLV